MSRTFEHFKNFKYGIDCFAKIDEILGDIGNFVKLSETCPNLSYWQLQSSTLDWKIENKHTATWFMACTLRGVAVGHSSVSSPPSWEDALGGIDLIIWNKYIIIFKISHSDPIKEFHVNQSFEVWVGKCKDFGRNLGFVNETQSKLFPVILNLAYFRKCLKMHLFCSFWN